MNEERRKYRKKPVVIEATQFHREAPGATWPSEIWLDKDGVYWCDTLEGPLKVSNGDWLIRGVRGELYPCKPDIFEATYERLEEGEAW